MNDILKTTIETVRGGSFHPAVAVMILGNCIGQVPHSEFSDAVIDLADDTNGKVPFITETDAIGLIDRSKAHLAARTATRPATGDMFDVWGKVRLGATDASISAVCGVLDRTLGVKPGETLLDQLELLLRDFTDAATSTTSLRDNPPVNTKTGEAMEVKGESRMFKGLNMGSSISAADKTATRIRKLWALQPHVAESLKTATTEATANA